MKIFAYGSNMSHNRLKKRVPSAIKISNGFVKGYTLNCSKISRKDGSGKATLNATGSNEELVWGVIYEIDENEKPMLDSAEGLNNGYNETMIEVSDGQEVHKTQIYLADKGYVNEELKPYEWYKAYMIEGAKENDLPKDYITKLDSLDANKDQNDERREKEMKILKG